MAGRKGAAVVVDVASGRVLGAYALDRAGRRLVRPGSAIKPFVLATLIDAGLLQNEPGVRCSRMLTVAGRKLNCGHPETQSPLHAEEALAYSCNSYFTQMSARLSGAQLQQGLLKWGLSSRPGLVATEVAGKIGFSSTVEQIELQGIGVENVLVTPIGLLSGYRKLALERRASADPLAAHAVVYSGMEASAQYGMARLAQPVDARYAGKPLRVAGKTGTSMAAEGLWTHGWFAGFAPADKPEIVVLVFLEHGTGPTDAAPVARKLFEAWTAESTQ